MGRTVGNDKTRAEWHPGDGSRLPGRGVGRRRSDCRAGAFGLRPSNRAAWSEDSAVRSRLPGRALTLPRRPRGRRGPEVAVDLLGHAGGVAGRCAKASRFGSGAGWDLAVAGAGLVRGPAGGDRRDPTSDRDRDDRRLSSRRSLGGVLGLASSGRGGHWLRRQRRRACDSLALVAEAPASGSYQQHGDDRDPDIKEAPVNSRINTANTAPEAVASMEACSKATT